MAIKSRPPKNGRRGLWNKVALALLDGQPHSPEEITDFFKNQPDVAKFLPQRLSTIQWQLRSFEGAVIKVTKQGKKVTGYQITNASEFDVNGFGPLRKAATAPVAAVVETSVTPSETTTTTEVTQ